MPESGRPGSLVGSPQQVCWLKNSWIPRSGSGSCRGGPWLSKADGGADAGLFLAICLI